MPGDLVDTGSLIGIITWKNPSEFLIAGHGTVTLDYVYDRFKISKDGGKTWQPFYKEVEI
jgi:hypothetical protein